ncbi:MAG: DJ-1/PfpI family protein [Salinibacter sp.]
MTVAFVLFDGLTALDFVGAYDPITRLHSMGFRDDVAWDLCAFRTPVHDGRGLRFTPDRVGASLDDYDLLVVPGGHGTDTLQDDEAFLEWLQTAAPVGLKASVCTGSVLLGAAGFLTSRTATTHPNATDELQPYCAQVVDDRVVDDGAVVTARGVSAGLDLGLHIVRRLAGPSVQAQIAEQMDYPYVLPAS